MRQITFERWSRKQLSSTLEGSFSLGLLAARAQSDGDTRLRALLLLYAESANRAERLLGYMWNEEVAREYLAAHTCIGGRNVGALALRGRAVPALPKTYNDVLADFAAAWGYSANLAAQKKALWEKARSEQLAKGIPNCQVYRALSLNPGNANAFLKHGAIEKLSLANVERIADYIASSPSLLVDN